MKIGFNLFRTDISTDITAHDLLKTFAIITMIIDHIGYFFYPQIEELRLIGRLSAPVWFFLLGYAMNQKLELRLWVWAFILFAGTGYMKSGMGMLPLNILLMFLFTRATLSYTMALSTKSFERLFGIFWVCLLLMIPSMALVEYGTLGFLFAMAGYMTRRKDTLEHISDTQLNGFMVLAILAYGFNMWWQFGFETINGVMLLILLACMCLSLLHFTARTFPANQGLLKIIKYPLFLTGRRTLEIYVLHFLFFMYLVVYGLPF